MEYSFVVGFFILVWLTVLGNIQAMSLYRSLLAKQDNTRVSPSTGVFFKLIWNPFGTSMKKKKHTFYSQEIMMEYNFKGTT